MDKNGKEYKDLSAMKDTIEALKARNSQLEEYLNDIIVNNSKMIEDNRFMALEMMNAK